MNIALQKTLVFLLLIAVGFLLRKKISDSTEVKGIKSIILNIALPATIFIALLKINIDADLLYLPLLALGINVILMGGAALSLYILGVDKGDSTYRTVMMLFPSFAPGLSCFPFLIEYFNDETLAGAALADVGNKIFVLILLYLLAMRWYYQKRKEQVEDTITRSEKIKDLFVSLISEPINAVLIIALLMLSFGLNIQSLPFFLSDTISRLSVMMTPLILLFIGLSVRVGRKDIAFILQLLFLRSGMAFLLSALLLAVLPASISGSILVLAILFPQSASSFWPYAHMTAVDKLESQNQGKQSIFDLKLGLNILAFSLPFSTAVIMGICSYSDMFMSPVTCLVCAVIFLSFGIVPRLLAHFKTENNSIPQVARN